MKILICEDETILLTALEFRMRKAGFDVVMAKDGKEALAATQKDSIDLVIADIDMPGLTGIELIQQLEKEKSNIPVIVISDLDYEPEIRKALTLGAKDFVIKPFKPAELVLRTKCILNMPSD